jgi:NRPS condensation-like uncharacterized protein
MQMKAENTFETTGQDWANYISRETDANGILYLAALLDGQPDEDILRQAVSDSVALQPVLGCRFDLTQDPPMWLPIQEHGGLFSVSRAETWQEGLAAFLREGPGEGQAAVRLVFLAHRSALLVRLDHAAADAGGLKAYLGLLNRLYNARLAGERWVEDISRDRGEGRVFESCGMADFRLALRREKPSPSPFLTFPYEGLEGGEVRYAFATLPLALVMLAPGATVNDLLLASCARALSHGTDGEQAVALHMTVDLRRYLKDEEAPAICNLSGMETVCLDPVKAEPFAKTLEKVCLGTSAIKAGHPGLGSAAAMAYLRQMPFEKARSFLADASRKTKMAGAAAPIVSNLGWLYKGTMKFGGVPVTDILPLAQAMRAPSFMLCAGSYAEHLTLSAGFFDAERKAEDVERFLQGVKAEMAGE